MRIPFDLAETLAVVVDEGTLDAAARRLRITPSAVSQRVKALESLLVEKGRSRHGTREPAEVRCDASH